MLVEYVCVGWHSMHGCLCVLVACVWAGRACLGLQSMFGLAEHVWVGCAEHVWVGGACVGWWSMCGLGEYVCVG